ncbi:MAG: hypothetical protein KGJ00_13915 [Bradyrhizobium sp.]|nr:hypothetical protein [Bradyrhizobium sp.]
MRKAIDGPGINRIVDQPVETQDALVVAKRHRLRDIAAAISQGVRITCPIRIGELDLRDLGARSLNPAENKSQCTERKPAERKPSQRYQIYNAMDERMTNARWREHRAWIRRKLPSRHRYNPLDTTAGCI